MRPAIFAGLLITAIWWHAMLFPIVPTDVAFYNMPWFNHIVETGPIAAFAHPFGDYNPPYLYLLAAATPLKGVIPDVYVIKLLSLLGNVAAAGAAWHLLTRLKIDDAVRLSACLMVLPSLLLNCALLGQSDAMYVAPLLMALAAAIDRRHRAMLGWCGLALGIKLQAVLFGPFILVLLIARRVPLRDWLWTPAIYLSTLVPAWLAGWPAYDLLTIYVTQADVFHDIARNAPNIWMVAMLIGAPSNDITGLAIAAAVGAVAAYLARFIATARHFAPVMLVRLALLAPLITAGLLPRMHERYFLLADILAVVLAIISTDRGDWKIAVFVQLGSICGLVGYATGLPWLAGVGALPMVAATWLTLRPLIWTAANDNPLMARRA